MISTYLKCQGGYSHFLMSNITKIEHATYRMSIKDEKHVFLVGDLKRETNYPFIRDSRLELIVCEYASYDDGLPHWHPHLDEYEIVTQGCIGYTDVKSGETTWFNKGDLSYIPRGVCVQRIVRIPSRTIALKVPSGQEKKHCRQCVRDCSFRLEPFIEGNENE